MAGLVFVAVLGAAVLHASWNAIAKAIPDQRVAAGVLAAAALPPGAIGAALLPLPDPGSWPFLATSVLLQSGYLLLLVQAYRYGEFGQVYPLARGLPPLLVTVVSLTVLKEQLGGGRLAGGAVQRHPAGRHGGGGLRHRAAAGDLSHPAATPCRHGKSDRRSIPGARVDRWHRWRTSPRCWSWRRPDRRWGRWPGGWRGTS